MKNKCHLSMFTRGCRNEWLIIEVPFRVQSNYLSSVRCFLNEPIFGQLIKAARLFTARGVRGCSGGWGGVHGCSGGEGVVALGGVWLLRRACMVAPGEGVWLL